MAKLSSRPHRTKPVGSYEKPDWKGYLKLALVIIFFIVLAIVLFNFFAVHKTPVRDKFFSSGSFSQAKIVSEKILFKYLTNVSINAKLYLC